MLTENSPAPDFTVKADDGSTVSLSSFRGKNVVLYFYPKDDTPGCTVESCEFRDAFPRFQSNNAVILGVSPDSVESHVKFKKKFNLPFTLLADEDKAIAKAYGVLKDKTMFGNTFLGIARTTFIIDKTGNIAKIFAKVTPAGHAEEVEQVLKQLN